MVRTIALVDFTIKICNYAVFSCLFSDSSRSDAADGSFQNFEAPKYLDFRAEALQHHKQRDELFKKAALAFSNKQGQLAKVYAEQVDMHARMDHGLSCPKVRAEYYQSIKSTKSTANIPI